jgi:hypothetical protein
MKNIDYTYTSLLLNVLEIPSSTVATLALDLALRFCLHPQAQRHLLSLLVR